jgi:hypothetical protein
VDGDDGHFWSYGGLSGHSFALEGLAREEMSFDDLVASRVPKGVVGLFYVESRPDNGDAHRYEDRRAAPEPVREGSISRCLRARWALKKHLCGTRAS